VQISVCKTRFFGLLKEYRQDPETFSLSYRRATRARLLPAVEAEIEGELLREKEMVEDRRLPIEVCTADRGYDDIDNHFFLQTRGIRSAIHLNRYRTEKKDPKEQVWLELGAQPWYKYPVRATSPA
jgi:hypothetical protein